MATLLLAGTLLAACTAEPTPSATPLASPTSTVTPPPSASLPATASVAPTPTPTPALSLEIPPNRDERQIQFSVAIDVPTDVGAAGKITVKVANLGKQRIDEIVLRWPTELRATLFMAPFKPSAGRVKEGVPLVVPWTKWVEGPGERGEPAGTTSLGWGPLLGDAELTIPLVVTRNAAGPVSFDLQFLSGVPAAGDVPPGGDALLTLSDGSAAETRVEVP